MKSNELYLESLRDTDSEFDWVKERQTLDILIEQHFKDEPKKREIRFAERPTDNPSEKDYLGQF